MTQTPSLHSGLQPAWELCEQIRAQLLAAVAGVAADEWPRRRPGSEWTLADQVDHLIKSETGSSKVCRKLIRGDFRALTRPAGVRSFDSGLSVYPFPPGQAPAVLVPAPSGGRDVLLSTLEAAHQRFREELCRFEGPDVDALESPDDTGLWFTLAGWVRVQALHEEHHLRQIAKLLIA